MPTLQTSPVKFINLDVEFRSTVDLTPIAKYLRNSIFVLYCGAIEGSYLLNMEPVIEGNLSTDSYNCTQYMLSTLEQLPQPYKDLMSNSTSRTFDFGFESELENNPISIEIPPTQMQRIAALEATLRITIYPYHSERETEKQVII